MTTLDVTVGSVGVRVAPRAVVVTIGLAVLAGAATLLALTGTDRSIAQVLDGIAARDFVMFELRLPRALAALGVGAALGAAGLVFQEIVRNPIVSPDIIGVNAGASLVAVVVLGFTSSIAVLVPFAFVGGIATALVVLALSWSRGVAGERLVLVGIGVNAMLVAASTLAVLRLDDLRLGAVARWTAGSLFATGWADVRVLGVVLAVGLTPLVIAAPRPLRVLRLGDDAARALGARVTMQRVGLLLLATLLASGAVAVAGPITFVALVAPHAARVLTGTEVPMPAAALTGATVVAVADVLAQRVLPGGLPVGIVTAATGAPFFVFLLWQANREHA